MMGLSFSVLGALIKDTFREAFASKIFWGLLALSTLMILFFLFLLRIDVVEGGSAVIRLWFKDADNGERAQNSELLMRQVYAGIATFLFTFGMFLAVFASSGLIPSLLEQGRIVLLLSKPIGRVQLLVGRYIGNLLVIFLITSYLVLGVWTILGLKTGIWNPMFLVTIATTMFLFSVLLALVVLMGVAFESGALATMVTMALGLMSVILSQERLARRLLSSEWSRNLWTTLYHLFPKWFDIGGINNSLVRGLPIESWLPLWTTAAFGAVCMAGALWLFSRKDY
jgi:ABC-2 type transport system permease protein